MSLLDRTDYKMTTEHEYATYAARLASFESSVSVPIKKRTSNAKGTKSITWPHQNPSPAELATAGFYYKPSVEAPDNTICYTCERQLDGWEEDDDPIVEHLKHSENCGWAILIEVMKGSHDAAMMEDPTAPRIKDARTSSFQIGWPHETKRGWVCKTEKMVQAGWHFAPTPESDDFVSCAYCKLSLDGWEPKDNPFNEHYRRSPDCPFFTFAGTTAPKAGKGKKGRASKATRESIVTIASEAPSIPDLNESIDTSTVSILSTASTMGKGKNARGKAKAARHNKVNEISDTQPNASIIEVEVETVPEKPKRAKKRGSEQISEDRGEREGTAKPEPPAKRRNTGSKNNVLQQVDYPSIEPEPDALEAEILPAKPVKGGRKRASTTTRSRKTSGASIASLRIAAPELAAIEAAIAADLEKPLSDEEMDNQPEKPKRGRSKKATASKAPIRGKQTTSQDTDDQGTQDVEEVIAVSEEMTATAKPPAKRGRKPKATKEAAHKRESNESNATAVANIDTVIESSMVTMQTADDDSGHETDASIAGNKTKKGGKRKIAAKGKGKKGVASKNIEDIVQIAEQIETAAHIIEEVADEMDVSAEIAVLNAEIEKEEAAAAAKPKKAPKVKKGKKVAEKPPHLSMPGAFSPIDFREESIEPSFMSAVANDTPPVRINTIRKAEGLETTDEMVEVVLEKTITPTPTPRQAPALHPRSPARMTPISGFPRETPKSQTTRSKATAVVSPAGSAQSSDAENAPPSSRPVSVRPPLGDMTTTTRVRLNPGTPTRVPLSPSKIGGGIRSQIPWTEIDVEMILAGTPGEKNDDPMDLLWRDGQGQLAENEKAMNVQEWIYWHASRAEESLKHEAERVVSMFEKEGARAMEVLEGIECS